MTQYPPPSVHSAAPAPRPVQYPRPQRVEPVPGTPFGLAILDAPRTFSGPAAGSLATGIGSILIAMAVWCFGTLGSAQGWGAVVSGAFTVPAVLLGLAALVLGGQALRQIRRAVAVTAGRGLAISGMICGGCGVLAALTGLLLAIALTGQGTLT